MYADDIVLFSDTEKGLQHRMKILEVYCSQWCLNVNISKTKVLVFNKPGKFFKCPIYFKGETVECVNTYKYLGLTFISSGKFQQCKLELFKKSLKASFKLQSCLSSTNPSISTLLHLFAHTVKPILMYGSEIWGMFNFDSVKCKNTSDYFLE